MKSSSQIDRAAALDRSRAILALDLIVPVSSIAAVMTVWIAPGIIGQAVAVCCGIWMLLFPILWHIFVDRQQLKFNFNKPQGFGGGLSFKNVRFCLVDRRSGSQRYFLRSIM
jgi:uncharacterized protein